MDPGRVGAGVALAFLVLVVVMRLPHAIRQPHSRLIWLATATGSVALFAVGVVVPLEVLDGWLGGTNVLNLIQNVLATTAFWLLMRATLILDGSRLPRMTLWELPVMLIAFTLPFMAIPDRGPSSTSFIVDHAHKPELWAYASLYMLAVAAIMVRAIIGIRGREPRQYVLIRVGAAAIAAGSLVEVIYLTLRVLQVGDRGVVEAIGSGFAPLFYGGVVVVTAGLGAFALMRWVRVASWSVLRVLLSRTRAVEGIDLDSIESDSNVHAAYRLAVRLTDIANTQQLSAADRFALRTSARILDRQMRAPAVIRMSSRSSDALNTKELA